MAPFLYTPVGPSPARYRCKAVVSCPNYRPFIKKDRWQERPPLDAAYWQFATSPSNVCAQCVVKVMTFETFIDQSLRVPVLGVCGVVIEIYADPRSPL